MDVYGRLYYLSTVEDENTDDVCNGCHDIQTWHRILGHCNFEDVSKLEKVFKGMSIKGKHDMSNHNCENVLKAETGRQMQKLRQY